MQYDKKLLWKDNEKQYTDQELFDELNNYVEKGGVIYVGTDSMLYNDICKFASVVAIHSNDQKIGKYFYKRASLPAKKYKKLQNKIFEEVDCSLEIARKLEKIYPHAKIEVHVDIGIDSKCKTKKYIDTVKGWVNGLGFAFKFKPKSWASSVADWYSK
tara:strand:+ start:83 stop:556 length:474 start_codon:yes stop_codon:yes gene_type:complete